MARTIDHALNDRRRAEIVEAAVRCAIRKGFHQSSMQDICAEAKLSAGAVYRYFDSKQAIIEAIAARDKAETFELIKALENCENFVSDLQLILAEVMKYFTNPDHGRLGVEIMAEASRNLAVAELFAKNERELKNAFVHALKTAKRRNQIDASLKPEAVADTLMILIDGMSARAILDKNYSPKRLEKTIRLLVKRFLAPASQ